MYERGQGVTQNLAKAVEADRGGRTLKLWSASDGALRRTLQGREDAVMSCCFWGNRCVRISRCGSAGPCAASCSRSPTFKVLAVIELPKNSYGVRAPCSKSYVFRICSSLAHAYHLICVHRS